MSALGWWPLALLHWLCLWHDPRDPAVRGQSPIGFRTHRTASAVPPSRSSHDDAMLAPILIPEPVGSVCATVA